MPACGGLEVGGVQGSVGFLPWWSKVRGTVALAVLMAGAKKLEIDRWEKAIRFLFRSYLIDGQSPGDYEELSKSKF